MREMNTVTPGKLLTSVARRSSDSSSSNISDDARNSHKSSFKTGTKSSSKTTTQKRISFKPEITLLPGHNTQASPTKIFQVAPEAGLDTAPTQKTSTFQAKLDFTKPFSKGFLHPAKKEFNVPDCFKKWIQHTRNATGSFVLLLYDNTTESSNHGHQITHEDQLPTSVVETISTYLHNHQVTQSGTLTGMVKFSIDCTWIQLKDIKKAYFKWLSANNIYLKQINFQADTVALAGWIYGAHADITRKDDSSNELRKRLELPPGVEFQLVPRFLNVAESKGSKNRFQFKAVAVETDGKNVSDVREAFYKLGNPEVENLRWPIMGKFPFVPMTF
jgi:hypothetical protein